MEQKTGLRTDRPKAAELPLRPVGGGEVVATVEIDVAVAWLSARERARSLVH